MMFDSMADYPLDQRDGESEDQYLDRLISLLPQPEDAALAVTYTPAERTVRGGRCTTCEKDSSELWPWSGQRICQDCFDRQLDLLAMAVREATPGAHLVFGADVPEPFDPEGATA